MKPNENVAKDLAYQQMIYNKLLEIDGRFASLFPYTNMAQDVLQGGTRLRQHPLPGISIETFEPSTLATGGNHDDFFPKKSRPAIHRPPQKLLRKNGNITTLSAGGNNRMDLVKKIMKEQGLNLPQASKFIKENGLYKKAQGVVKKAKAVKKMTGGKSNSERVKEAYEWENFAKSTANDGIDLVQKATDPFKHVKNLFGGEVEGGGNKSGKVNRLKKAKRWTKYTKDTINDGMDLAERGLEIVNKQKDPLRQIKGLFGGDVKAKRPPSQWVQFVKQYASKNGIPYKDALKQAGPAYRKMKA